MQASSLIRRVRFKCAIRVLKISRIGLMKKLILRLPRRKVMQKNPVYQNEREKKGRGKMYNFNDEERALFEIYKAKTSEETIQNIEENINEAFGEIREKLIIIKDSLQNGN